MEESRKNFKSFLLQLSNIFVSTKNIWNFSPNFLHKFGFLVFFSEVRHILFLPAIKKEKIV